MVLTSKSCPHCEAFKNRYRKEIESGEFKVVELEDNRQLFIKLAKEFNVDGVPTVLGVVEEEGKKKLCKLDFKERKFKDCKEVELDI